MIHDHHHQIGVLTGVHVGYFNKNKTDMYIILIPQVQEVSSISDIADIAVADFHDRAIVFKTEEEAEQYQKKYGFAGKIVQLPVWQKQSNFA